VAAAASIKLEGDTAKVKVGSYEQTCLGKNECRAKPRFYDEEVSVWVWVWVWCGIL